jgi:hypothetical protein
MFIHMFFCTNNKICKLRTLIDRTFFDRRRVKSYKKTGLKLKSFALSKKKNRLE